MRAFNRPKKPKHEIKAAYKRRISGHILYTKGAKSKSIINTIKFQLKIPRYQRMSIIYTKYMGSKKIQKYMEAEREKRRIQALYTKPLFTGIFEESEQEKELKESTRLSCMLPVGRMYKPMMKYIIGGSE